MESRHFDSDPLFGLERTFHYDDVNDLVIIQTAQDIEPYLEANAELRKQDERSGWKGDWHRVASIPMPLYMKLCRERQVDKDEREMKRFLNDPDNKVFRTKLGEV